MVHRHHHATRVLPLTNHFESVPNSEFFFFKKKNLSSLPQKKLNIKKNVPDLKLVVLQAHFQRQVAVLTNKGFRLSQQKLYE